jgi:hypothetical protein
MERRVVTAMRMNVKDETNMLVALFVGCEGL